MTGRADKGARPLLLLRTGRCRGGGVYGHNDVSAEEFRSPRLRVVCAMRTTVPVRWMPSSGQTGTTADWASYYAADVIRGDVLTFSLLITCQKMFGALVVGCVQDTPAVRAAGLGGFSGRTAWGSGRS